MKNREGNIGEGLRTVVGLMSGTSMDGVDAALLRTGDDGEPWGDALVLVLTTVVSRVCLNLLRSREAVTGTVSQGTFSADRLDADLEARTVTLRGNARLRVNPRGAR